MQDRTAIPIYPHGFGVIALLAEALAPSPRFEPRRPDRKTTPANRHRRGWLARLDRWLWSLQQREFERYLAQSQDVYELERRIRAAERGQLHRYY